MAAPHMSDTLLAKTQMFYAPEIDTELITRQPINMVVGPGRHTQSNECLC